MEDCGPSATHKCLKWVRHHSRRWTPSGEPKNRNSVMQVRGAHWRWPSPGHGFMSGCGMIVDYDPSSYRLRDRGSALPAPAPPARRNWTALVPPVECFEFRTECFETRNTRQFDNRTVAVWVRRRHVIVHDGDIGTSSSNASLNRSSFGTLSHRERSFEPTYLSIRVSKG